MGYYSWYRQIGKCFYLSNMIFDYTIWTIFSKLSENHKKIDIGSTEFKLWQLIESTFIVPLTQCENLERNQPDLSTINFRKS